MRPTYQMRGAPQAGSRRSRGLVRLADAKPMANKNQGGRLSWGSDSLPLARLHHRGMAEWPGKTVGGVVAGGCAGRYGPYAWFIARPAVRVVRHQTSGASACRERCRLRLAGLLYSAGLALMMQ